MKKATIFISVLMLLIVFTAPAMCEEQATKEECIEMCKKAAKLIKEKGREEAFKILNDPKSQFVWKDSYVFVMEADSTILLTHPMKPALIGKNLIGMRDVNGKMFFVELANYANSKEGQGWVDYMWPKPGEKHSSPKSTFIYRVPGENLAAGAGIYY